MARPERRVSPSDMLGWTAASLMVATFSCRDARWMRPLAVCTNLAFIAYGWHAGLAPVLALHALLLPINALRWFQAQRALPC
jgi:CRP/FNR family transcriptional regulator, cyclic AMP receptor protein